MHSGFYGNLEVVLKINFNFLVPAKMGYGSEGAAPDIPPNATLVFVVECMAIGFPHESCDL